jgi:hypothetical protein
MTLPALREFPRAWLDDTAAVLGRELVALLRRLLAREPGRRCPCANEVASELEAIAKH